MTVLVQMPFEEYNALKAKADMTDQKIAEASLKTWDRLLQVLEEQRGKTDAFSLAMVLRQQKDHWLALCTQTR